MIRALVLAAAGLVVFFAACIGMAHALAYDDDSIDPLRAFLMPPDGCPAPCWEGIRPGVTTFAEAMRALEAHAWVNDYTIEIIRNEYTGALDITWSWSGQQPEWIRPFSRGVVRVRRGLVQQINIKTRIPFGDIWMALDRPDRGTFFGIARFSVLHYAEYQAQGLWLLNEIFCPLNPVRFWSTPTELHWTHGAVSGFKSEPYDLPGWFLRRAVCEKS